MTVMAAHILVFGFLTGALAIRAVGWWLRGHPLTPHPVTAPEFRSRQRE